jgi:hypothetical protein
VLLNHFFNTRAFCDVGTDADDVHVSQSNYVVRNGGDEQDDILETLKATENANF